MDADALGPLSFEPIVRRLVWGGRKLGDRLGKPIGPTDDHAESWEIADHREAVSRVDAGPHRGRTLRELIATRGRELLGPDLDLAAGFPLLIKFLDARQTLSVQVHPDDALGAEIANDRGKTEAWVILEAEPGALIYAGLRPGVDRQALESALSQGEIEPLLHRFTPKPGDCVFIPAGTVHAIGAGVLLTEIQQMSDATFRLHDWGRVGSDGRPRVLHVAESLRATDFARGPVDPVRVAVERHPWGTRERLVECPFFRIERRRLSGPARVGSDRHFTILIGLEGTTRLEGYPDTTLGAGRTVLLPASVGVLGVDADEGGATILVVEPGREKGDGS